MIHTGRHFLQIPGPTNVPDRILRAMDQPVIDHRGPEFAELGLEVLGGLRDVFQTKGHVIVYPSSGTGACEAALVNTLSAGDRVIIFETGQFSNVWRQVADRLGDLVHGVQAGQHDACGAAVQKCSSRGSSLRTSGCTMELGSLCRRRRKTRNRRKTCNPQMPVGPRRFQETTSTSVELCVGRTSTERARWLYARR